LVRDQDVDAYPIPAVPSILVTVASQADIQLLQTGSLEGRCTTFDRSASVRVHVFGTRVPCGSHLPFTSPTLPVLSSLWRRSLTNALAGRSLPTLRIE